MFQNVYDYVKFVFFVGFNFASSMREEDRSSVREGEAGQYMRNS